MISLEIWWIMGGYLSWSLSCLPGGVGMPNLCPTSSSYSSCPAAACSSLANASALSQLSAKSSVRRTVAGGGIDEEESVPSDLVVVSSARPLLAMGKAIRRCVLCTAGRDRMHRFRQTPQGFIFEAIVKTDWMCDSPSPASRGRISRIADQRAPELWHRDAQSLLRLAWLNASKIIWSPSRVVG